MFAFWLFSFHLYFHSIMHGIFQVKTRGKRILGMGGAAAGVLVPLRLPASTFEELEDFFCEQLVQVGEYPWSKC